MAIHLHTYSASYLPVREGISGIWNNIVRAGKEFHNYNLPVQNMIKGVVCNGREVRFWLDWWTGEVPLKDIFPELFSLERHKHASVEDRLNMWEWKFMLNTNALLDQLHQIEAVRSTIQLENRNDKWIWTYSGDRVFSVSSTKEMLNRFATPFYPYDWAKWVPKKVNIFGWRGVQDRLSTMVGLKKRGLLATDPVCTLCGERDEDADHLFIFCYAAAVLWHKVSNWCKVQQIFAHSIKDLFEFYKSAHLDEPKRVYLQSIILATCWAIWKARNEKIFKGKHVNIEGTFGEMQTMTFLWIKNRAKKSALWNGEIGCVLR
ncbi:uncharacterized protein LOC110869599 [Helianthus annuus]|uniref:uncharacterized protein LOC110869599 n=1 Tax=Helianthus annuus TaxID=4232 RepID=UPI000B8F3B6A|nr:uncharacterized protein LOC110869599 [Helianthus annuus]